MGSADPWFDSLYRKYSDRLIQIATAILRNPSVAQELVQDVFMILLLHRETVETYQNPYAYLLKVLKFRIGSEIQRESYKREEPLDEKHESIAATGIDTDCLEDILPDWLTKDERQFLIWRIDDGLSFQEIALRLNISEHACHARMYRLRKELKKRMKENGNIL